MNKEKLILPIAIVIASIVVGVSYYAIETRKLRLSEQGSSTSGKEVGEIEKKPDNVIKEQDSKASSSPAISRSTETTIINDANDKIKEQIKIFDDYLEYDLVGSQVDCQTLAIYNSLSLDDPSKLNELLPKGRAYYDKICRDSFYGVVKNKKNLVAEPELQNLRILLSSYTEEVEKIATYAMNGGYKASYLDPIDAKMDELRTLSREEVIRLKRKYKIEQ